jgi:hypothetical protein
MAGFLILAGTLVLVQTAWYPIAFWMDPREDSIWYNIADHTY